MGGVLRASSAVAARTIRKAESASALGRIVSEPQQFDFFQAVRLLSLAGVGGQSSSDRGPESPGYDVDEMPVRFRAEIGLGFPATAVSSFAMPPADSDESNATPVPEMTVTFLGLVGTGGVLPRHYTQLLIDTVRAKELGLRDFFDLFNNRLVAQFYRAWEKCHFFVDFELSRRGNGETDRFTKMLFGLVGLGTPGLSRRQSISDDVLAHYSGHFAHHPRPAVALGQIISDLFRLPTEIQQFRGQWMLLPTRDRTQLRRGRNNELGVSAIAGSRVWGIEHKFRVRLRVNRYEKFREFMPDGQAHRAFADVVRSFVGPAYDFDLQLVLPGGEVPPCRLGSAAGTRLGWNAWMFSNPVTRDVDDAVFACEGMPRR
jgi:type VI secretion system protein ImpH